MRDNRVVITGAGVISPIGIGVEEFWKGCLLGTTIVSKIPKKWEKYADLKSRIWCPLPEFNAERLDLNKVDLIHHDYVSLYAICAAKEAVLDAGFSVQSMDKRRNTYSIPQFQDKKIGVYLGTGIGGVNSFVSNLAHHINAKHRKNLEKQLLSISKKGDRRAVSKIVASIEYRSRFNPFVVSLLMPNAASSAVGIKFGIEGENVTYSLACASGTVSVGRAYESIKGGELQAVLAGGSEYLMDEYGAVFRGFDAAGTLVKDYVDEKSANRPFDKNRSGFLFSQGAAVMLVIESLESAMNRNANIYAEIIGYAETFDAYSMMSIAPDGQQIELALRSAIAKAGLDIGDIDYVNAHGTGTENNDDIESQVINRVFGSKVLVNATKSLVGHALGAAGSLEILVTALSLRDQTTHICVNLDDPIADLNFVRKREPLSINVGLSQSFGFGGHNAAIVLKRFTG